MYIIWWLTAYQCEDVGVGTYAFDKWQAPEYIKTLLRRREGRAGRGRLWVADDIPVERIDWNKSAAEELGLRDSGGLVIHERDYHHIAGAPGIVTTIDMQIYKPVGDGGE